MMLSTPACHGPFTPAPKYQNNFPNETAPRDGSYNRHGHVGQSYGIDKTYDLSNVS